MTSSHYEHSRWPTAWTPAAGAPPRVAGLDAVPDPAEDDWRQRAACRGRNDDLFFPVGHGPGAEAQTWEAKKLCAVCPVVRECLTWALETGQEHGIWGGLDEDELKTYGRRRYRARRRRAEKKEAGAA